MKNSLSISVKEPCSQDFNSFKATPNGGFCGSCHKEVIDFTKLSDEELIKHFNLTSEKTCGRFKKSQLKSYEPMISNISNQSIVSKGIAIMSFSLLSLCALNTAQAQNTANNDQSLPKEINITMGAAVAIDHNQEENYTVTGTVLDDENNPLAGVNVVLKGSVDGIITDFDGKFEFPKKLSVDDVLVFSYIGYETKQYTITPSKTDTIDINITFNSTDIFLMGEVEMDGVYESKPNIFQKFISIFK